MLFKDRNIVLASASPRRLDILRQIGIEPEVYVSNVEEISELIEDMDAEALVVANASRKAKVAADLNKDAIVIGSDTVVVMDNKLFGKPQDEQEALSMLKQLSGKSHLVYTGICLIDTKENKSISGADMVKVTFHQLSDLEINEYIATREPMDKAGAYGIQGKGALFVDKIDGDYYSVMGLSVSLMRKLALALKSF